MGFQYFVPQTLEEAHSLLQRYGEKIRLLAGGTDLLLKLREKNLEVDYVADITRIAELNYIRGDEKEGLKIGATTPLRALENSPVIQKACPILYQAAHQLGSVAIRNVATLGGNLCNASPSADTAPALIAVSAKARVKNAQGERLVRLEEFFTGPGETILKEDEILVEIQVPPIPAGTRGIYLKHSVRGSIDLPIVGVAVALTLEEEVCREIRIALGAVAPTPRRAREAERILIGRRLDEELISRAAQRASEESQPITDARASAAYRQEMVRILTGRAIRRVLEEKGK